MPRKKGIKGAGSVFRRKSDGRWVAQFKDQETGRFIQRYAPKDNNTEQAAYAKLQQALREQEQGILATGPQRKLGDHLNWWLEEVHRHTLRESSYLRYRSALDTHIIPGLGDIQLRKLTTERIQAFYNAKLKKDKLSPSSVHILHKILHNGLKYAVRSRLIPYNPSDAVSLPAEEERDVPPLTIEQAKHLLRTARGHRLEGFITLTLATGMRHGELLALRWADVDLEQGTVHVHRTYTNRGTSKRFEGKPKTKAGERTLALSKTVCARMKQHRERQDAMRLKAGPLWKENDLVFSNEKGGFLDDSGVRYSFYRLLEKAGLPRMHIHDLRHAANTLYRKRGVDPKTRQAMMGHSSVDMTENEYDHTLPGDLQDAAEKMDDLFE